MVTTTASIARRAEARDRYGRPEAASRGDEQGDERAQPEALRREQRPWVEAQDCCAEERACSDDRDRTRVATQLSGEGAGVRWATTSTPATRAAPASRTHGTMSVPEPAAAARAARIAADRPATSSIASDVPFSGPTRPHCLLATATAAGASARAARKNVVSIRSRWPTARSATETATRRAIATFAIPMVTSSSVVPSRAPPPRERGRGERGKPGRGRDAHAHPIRARGRACADFRSPTAVSPRCRRRPRRLRPDHGSRHGAPVSTHLPMLARGSTLALSGRRARPGRDSRRHRRPLPSAVLSSSGARRSRSRRRGGRCAIRARSPSAWRCAPSSTITTS